MSPWSTPSAGDRDRDRRADRRVEVVIAEDAIQISAPFRLDLQRKDLRVITSDPRARARVVEEDGALAVVVRARDGTRRRHPVRVDPS